MKECASMTANKQGEPVEEKAAPLSAIAVVVAVVLIAAYLVGLVVQWGQIGAAELPYGRGLHLIGGLEALAFAAAGALFGNAVQRQVTDKAEKKAATEKKRADDNESAAGAGKAVVNLARVKAEGAAEGRRGFADQNTSNAVRTEMAELVSLAEKSGL
jgi:hypothetical protein